MFLLDTNVISELRKASSGRADRGVVRWASQVPTALLFISAISVYELEYGVLLLERSDPRQGAPLRAWLDGAVLPAFDGRVLEADAAVATRAAGYCVPDPAPFRDSLIGATAAIHGLTVVTRNTRDFTRFDVAVLDPFIA